MEAFTDDSSFQSNTNNDDLKSPTDIHTVELVYKCDQCDLLFIDKSELLEHVQSSTCNINPGKQYYQCSDCNKTSSDTGVFDVNMQ